jgi:hypothetical protein
LKPSQQQQILMLQQQIHALQKAPALQDSGSHHSVGHSAVVLPIAQQSQPPHSAHVSSQHHEHQHQTQQQRRHNPQQDAQPQTGMGKECLSMPDPLRRFDSETE